MKKALIIIGGILLILLLGAWGYLLMFGTPESAREVFTRFEEGSEIPQDSLTEDPDITDTVIDTAPERFKQLTTRPVAGATFTESGVRYVEQGTGHIYDIDLETGEITLLSGTTFPRTTKAVFSADASSVIISTLNDNSIRSIIAELSTTTLEQGSIEAVSMPENATDLFFREGHAYYLLKQENGSTGYRYDIKKKTATSVFSIPLRDMRVVWGDTIYAYTIPTARQSGSVYQIKGSGTLGYVTTDAPGLVAVGYENGVIATSMIDGELSSTAVTKGGARADQSFPAIPEKCVQDPLNAISVFCAVPTNIGEGEFPDSWYMGKLSYSDTLWRLNTETGGASLLLDFTAENGNPMDVHAIGSDPLGTRLFIINKHDNTLWLFDRSID